MHRHLLTLVFLSLLSLPSMATHSMGGVITYRALDSFKYEITITYYRDCRGTAFSTPAGTIRALGGSSRSLSLSLHEIKEVTPLHDTISGRCDPQNTYGTGEGIERHIYMDTVDFNVAPFTFLKTACRILIESGQCCRNGAINTGLANANYYNYAELNQCVDGANSSPRPGFEPHAMLCCNQPVFANLGFQETDGDSISYSFAHPLSAWNSQISYSGTYYAYNHPFQVYYPGSYSPPYTNPNAVPPIGIYLDPESGDLIFTPTRCDEVTVAVIQATEWRKDSTGTFKVISVVRQDQQYIAKSCPSNNPPEIDGPYAYQVCEGSSLCFNITTDDQRFVPPPPASPPAPDTVRIVWNEGIDGASFTIVNDSARLQTGRFCWTPPVGSARTNPYAFVAQARDNHSPLNALVERSFSIRVKKRAGASTTVTPLSCGQYRVQTAPDSFSGNSFSFGWDVLDTSGQGVYDPNVVRFHSTGNFLSIRNQDTLHVLRNGTYILRHTIRNSPENCPQVYFDTITVTDLVESHLSWIDSTACTGETLRLRVSSSGSTPVAYHWLRNGDTLSTTFNYLDVRETQANQEAVYGLVTYDMNGCVTRQEATLRTYPAYFPVLDDTIAACESKLILDADTFMNAYLWSTGDTSSSILVYTSGPYTVQLFDSFGCEQAHQFEALLHTPPSLSLRDTQSCAKPVQVDPGLFATYRWDDGSMNRIRSISASGLYSLQVTDSNGCEASDSLQVTIDPLPPVHLFQPAELCCNAAALDLDLLVTDQDLLGGSWSSATYPASLDSGLFDPIQRCAPFTTGTVVRYSYTDPSTGCLGADSVTVRVNPLPRVVLSDSSYCRNIQLIDLGKDLVRIPTNPYNGNFTWDCVDCNGNDPASIIEDRGKVGVPAYFLWVRADHYQMKNPLRDTVRLSYSYTDPKGCKQTDSVQLIIDELPDTPFITKQGRWLYSSVPNVQWYYEGSAIPGAIGDSLYLVNDGRYRAKGTEQTACAQELSNQISVLLSVEDFKSIGLEVYPNPHDGRFELRSTQGHELHSVQLYDASGRTVDLEWQRSGNAYRVFSNAASGWYVLEVRTDQGTFRTRLQKR